MSRSGSRWWQLLLAAHLAAYALVFMISLANFQYYVWYQAQNTFMLLLVWLPLLIIHVGAHFYYAGRGDMSKLERQAYREGLADALRQLGQRDESVERLALDDEGELVELEVKRKR